MKKMKKRILVAFLVCFLFCALSAHAESGAPLTAPKLTNNPSYDVIVTNTKPLLSFFNASGGSGTKTYEIELDRVPTFDSSYLIKYKNVPETNQHITDKKDFSHKLIEEKDALNNKTRYYWRVRAVDNMGNKGPWAKSRFFLDTKADDSFMNLVRVPVSKVEVSSGANPKNITDLDDPGQSTFWQSTPPGAETQWVKFDLGETRKISRVWMLSNPSGPDGWLKSFVWQMSRDGKKWKDIEGTSIKHNDTFRNIINFSPVKTRFVRLFIKKWYGYAVQVNAITIYSPGKPLVPKAPEKDYVLLVGNQENGFTFSELADFVEGAGLGLATLTVPHYEVSLDMLNRLDRKPVAIILSGNNANYPNLPMFEYNGEYEIIRHSEIPVLGICCGHQQLAMAYGYTYARSMGWDDISAMEKAGTRAEIKKMKDDPVFKGMKDPFTAVEIHGWAVAIIPDGFELLAESTYVQAMRNKSRMVYGEQFHGEIKAPYNEGTPYLVNFLKLALEKTRD
ncbi:discoidin domain-containing protein [Candidatus Omnitrophota bacterium]